MVAKVVQDRVKALVDSGAVMAVLLPNGTIEMPVGGVYWQGDALVWCSVFPQDQHHAHMQEDGEPRVVHGRDVGWYDAQGKLLAYLCPWYEAGSVDDRTRYEDELARWQGAVRDKVAQDRLQEFLRECFA